MLKEDKKSKFKQGFTKSTAKGGAGYFMGTWEAGRRKTDALTPALWFSEDAVGFDDIKKHYQQSLSTDSKIDGRVETDDSGNWSLIISPTSKVKTKTALVQLVRAFAESYKDDSKLQTICKKNDFKKITESSIKVQRKRSVRPVERDEIAPPRPLGEVEDGPEDDFVEGSEILDEGTFEIPESITLFLPTRSQVESSKAGKPNSGKDADHSSYVSFLETLHVWHLQYPGGVVPWEARDDAAKSLVTLRTSITDWVSKHKVFKKERRTVLKSIHTQIEEHLGTLQDLQVEAAIARGSEAFSDPTTAPQMLLGLEQSLQDDVEDDDLTPEQRLLAEARLAAIKRQTARLKLDKIRKESLDGQTSEEKDKTLTSSIEQIDLVTDLVMSEGVTQDSGKAVKTAVLTVETLLGSMRDHQYKTEISERDETDEKEVEEGDEWTKLSPSSMKLTDTLGHLLDQMATAGSKKEAQVILARVQSLAEELIKLEIVQESKSGGDWEGSIMRNNDLATVVARVVLERTDNQFLSKHVDVGQCLSGIGSLSHARLIEAKKFLASKTQPDDETRHFANDTEAEKVITDIGDAIAGTAKKIMEAVLVSLNSLPTTVIKLAQTAFDVALATGDPPDGNQDAAGNAAVNIVMLRWLNPQITGFAQQAKDLDQRLINQVQNLIQKTASGARPKDHGSDYKVFLSRYEEFFDEYQEPLKTATMLGISRFEARLL